MNSNDGCIKPTKKSKGIDSALKSLFGIDRIGSIKSGKCTTCSKSVKGFKDQGSRKEYTISGMCQECQDGIFG